MNLESTILGDRANKVFVLGFDAKTNSREQHLVEHAARIPVLFEMKGDRVIGVWTGWRMGYVLCREFGAVAAWQVLQWLQDQQCGDGKSPG